MIIALSENTNPANLLLFYIAEDHKYKSRKCPAFILIAIFFYSYLSLCK